MKHSRDWLWGLILVLAVILVYQPVWYAGFIWDDDEVVTANPCMVGPLGLKAIWTTSAADICPLVLTTFWVEHALWGLTPLPYHLVNVLMHGVCAVLLWRVLRGLRVPGAWLGAALWALHPVQVESVAWVSEMKNTQSGLFFLLSIFFFVRWLNARDSDGQTRGAWNYALILLFAALAMASKSSTVILPVVLCLCAWWVEGRWHGRNLTRVAPIFLMSIIASAVSIWTQGLQLKAATAIDPQLVRTWPERLITAGDVVWFYLGKLAWPHPLITFYPRRQIDAGWWFSYLPLLVVIIVLFTLWLKRESWSRPWFFVFAYFLTTLLPMMGLVNLIWFWNSFVADHFQYLAGMGPLALVGAGMVGLAKFVVPKKPWLQSGACAGLLLILGLLSRQRVWAYESQETLCADTLAKNPNSWAAHAQLGSVYFQKGWVDQAMAQFQMALKINPNYAQAHNSFGDTLLQKGRVDEAIAQYQKALEINPDFSEAHDNLGLIFVQRGQMDEAMAQFQMALKINPTYAEACNSLGGVLLQKGRVDEAMAQFQKALEINPNYDRARYNLGTAFLQKGQVDEAIAQFQKALKINPNYADAHNNLGIALLQKGQVGAAISQFQESVRLKPDDGDAQTNLAKAQALIRPAQGSQ